MKKTTLKWNCLFAAVAIGGVVAATSCVKNEESDSVKAIREAQVSKVSADAAVQHAQAAVQQANAKKQELENQFTEAVLNGRVEAKEAEYKQALTDAQKLAAEATKTLVEAKQAIAVLEAKAKADHPNLAAWQGLYEKLYGTTFSNSGLYTDLARLVGDLNDTRVSIITANFSTSSATETLWEKDSIAAKKELDYQQNLLSIYEAVAGKTVVPGDTSKVLSKKSTITAAEWAELKNILTGYSPDAQVNSKIVTLTATVRNQISRYDAAVSALATYRAGLYGAAESLKALEQKATDYEARIALLNSEIEDIEGRMAKLLE